DAALLRLQEAYGDMQACGSGALHQALALHPPCLAAARLAPRARCGDAELPAHLIFARRGAVRIEDVTLVENRVGHLAGLLHAHASVRSAPASSAPTVSSQVVSARRFLKRSKASSVSRCSRSQPLFGK